MTINSNPNLIGAYRELGRHYTRLAIDELDRARAPGGERRFAVLLCWQAAHPIIGTPTDKSFHLHLPAADKSTDLSLEGWLLDNRDAARLTEARPLPDAPCTSLGLPPAP